MIEAAVADNCRFDERAGDDRWQQFEDLLSDLVADRGAVEVEWQDWTEANRLHLDRYCNVPRPSVPDAFLDINRSAWLDALSDNQTLVRIEALSRPLETNGLELDGLTDLLQPADSGDGDAGRAVHSFFDAWNQRRDVRPAFAAFTMKCGRSRTTMIGLTRSATASGSGTTGRPEAPRYRWR